MKNLNSEKYPGFTYDIDDELFEMGLILDGQDAPFSIDIDESMTKHEDLVNEYAKHLDNIVCIKEKIINDLVKIYEGKDSENKESIDFIMEFYIEDIDLEYQYSIFDVSEEEYKTLSVSDLLRKNQLVRFGLVDSSRNREEDLYIIDLNFNPDYTDQLLVVYLDKDLNITTITNES